MPMNSESIRKDHHKCLLHLKEHEWILPQELTEVDHLQGVPPTEGEGETMVTP